MFWSVSFALLAALLGLPVSSSQNPNPLGLNARQNNGTNKQPNIIFLLTDDQDLEMGSLNYMPNLHKYMIEQGTTYNKHFCTISLCCPSRVSLWTGRLAHNTNVTDVLGPYGGYEVFISQGLNDKYLPVWLQEAGYNTYYSGKLFNSHSFENYDKPFAAGWNGSEFLLDPYQYDYYEPGFARNHDAPIAYPGNYSTDMVKDFAMGFLDEAVEAGSPFFLGIAPIASHAEVSTADNGTNAISTPPQPHTQYANLFPNASVPRTPNYNPDEPSGAAWIYSLPIINSSNVEYFDEWYRDRLRTLQSVEEIIEELIVKLEEYDILDNTYIFYTTDNGYHIGQHRLPPGKTCPWETDVHIPLIVRGPGIAANASTEVPTSHTDLTPTFFEMFGIPLRPEFDGAPIPYTPADFTNETKTAREHIGIEFWNNRDPNENGPGLLFGLYNTTYKAIRIVGDTYEIYYSVWCENYHEMYDMIADPYQMHNLFPFGSNTTSTELVPTNATLLGASLHDVATRLDGMMMVLKTCTAESCRQPWKYLIPNGSVTNLQQALDPKYDSLFEQLPRVSWTWCDPGYIISAEGPQFGNITITENESGNFTVTYV